MQRTLMILAMVAVLVIPLMASANDQDQMPSMQAPSPSLQPEVNLEQLVHILVAKGVLNAHDYAHLTDSQGSVPLRPGQARVWTWDEIDHDPVLRAGRSGGD